jgi:glycosyltransferase involved in cell wall biosynthesis
MMPADKKPKLLVEALATRNDSGLGKLVRMFAESLEGLADLADIHFILPKGANFKPGFHCTPIWVNPKPMRVWNHLIFPMLIRKLQPQAVLCLGWTLPLWRPKARYGLLLADVGPAEDLGFAMSSRDQANRRWLKQMPIHADLILTNAEFTKKRMLALLGLAAGRIKVIRPIHPSWFAHGSESVLGQYPAHPYFLSIGNVEPRKNFPGLIAAYARLKQRQPDAPPLYIIGHKAWGFQEAQAMAIKLGVSNAVIFSGYLSDRDRNAYLAHCTVFISSSLYEGWGLPLFEALALQRPAIYHANSSQDEFAQGLALGIDCADLEQLSQAMETLWTQPKVREQILADLQIGFPERLKYDLKGELKAAILPLLSGA